MKRGTDEIRLTTFFGSSDIIHNLHVLSTYRGCVYDVFPSLCDVKTTDIDIILSVPIVLPTFELSTAKTRSPESTTLQSRSKHGEKKKEEKTKKKIIIKNKEQRIKKIKKRKRKIIKKQKRIKNKE